MERQRNGSESTLRYVTVCFQYRFGYFLYEQRDAVGALDDIQPDARRQRPAPGYPVDQASRFHAHQGG